MSLIGFNLGFIWFHQGKLFFTFPSWYFPSSYPCLRRPWNYELCSLSIDFPNFCLPCSYIAFSFCAGNSVLWCCSICNLWTNSVDWELSWNWILVKLFEQRSPWFQWVMRMVCFKTSWLAPFLHSNNLKGRNMLNTELKVSLFFFLCFYIFFVFYCWA